ncbi:hypothetical protein [Halospeciosus flavus]|uniref:DUF7847 domain-containing protein n=1 Tax=Halospeciosus flavus TaxID=3032283 RepID=A0ABD5Z3D2_9EURY|nr:hypothetical protein [Halospeciosus flavus]
MAVLNALRRTPSALARNPVVFVPVLVLMLFQLPQFLLQTVDPLLSSLVSLVMTLVFVLAVPFFQGGMIAMADESLDGHTSLQTFIEEGKANYVSIFVAYLALMAVNLLLGMVAFFLGIFGGVLYFGSGGLDSANILILAIFGAVVLLVVLLYMLVLFFVQFYGQAIVLEGHGAVEGLKRSVSVVRHHLVSTLGYTVLCGGIGGVAGAVFGVASLLMSPRSMMALSLPEPSLLIIVGTSLLVVAGGTVFGGVFAVYSVSFYRTLTR